MSISKKQYLLLFLLLFIIMPQCLAATETETLFDQGNRAFSQGNYEQAIDFFEDIVENSGYSASLLYNLANSYVQNGQIGKAIVNYERAAILSPSDSDISGNLDKVRKESGLFQQEPEGVDRLFSLFSINQWATLTLLILAIVTLFLIFAVKISFGKSLRIGVYSSSIILLALTASGVFTKYQQLNPSIVTSSSAKILISPFESSTSVGAIQEGRRVYPVKTHGAYSYVTDAAGRKGWLMTSEIESVCGGI